MTDSPSLPPLTESIRRLVDAYRDAETHRRSLEQQASLLTEQMHAVVDQLILAGLQTGVICTLLGKSRAYVAERRRVVESRRSAISQARS